MHRTPLLSLTSLALLCGSPLAAQIPANHIAIGTVPDLNGGSGTSGLFYMSLDTGATTRVTGLPAKFVKSSGRGGVWSVLRRSDERLVLGTGAGPSSPISMTMVTMAGSVAVPGQRKNLVVGTTPPGWSFGLGATALMPDGKRVLFGTPSVIYGQMNGHRLGIADLDANPPTITPITLRGPMLGTFVYSMTVSRDNETAFVITGMGNADARPFRIYMVNLNTGALALLYTDTVRFPWYLQLRGTDRLFTAANDFYSATPKATDFLEFQITGWGQANITRKRATVLEGVFAGPHDETSGLTVMSSFDFNTVGTHTPHAIFLGDHRTGDLNLLGKAPAGGWGFLNSYAIHSTLDPYGASPQEDEVSFRTFPNAGGSPTAGNASFSLTVETTATVSSPASLMLIGAQSLDVPLIGTQLLVDPLLVVPIPSPTPTNPVAIPLPIPGSTPPGTELFVQWALCGNGTCKGSRGLKIVTQ